MVVNTNPAQAFCWRDNSLPLHVLVMAHVYGHSDFFANNVWFRRLTHAERALDTFRAHCEEIDVYREHRALVESSGAAVQAIYLRNIFPDMKVTWGTHPNHIGHEDFLGCFRCHDDNHVSKDGKTISQSCDTCHNLLAQDESEVVQARNEVRVRLAPRGGAAQHVTEPELDQLVAFLEWTSASDNNVWPPQDQKFRSPAGRSIVLVNDARPRRNCRRDRVRESRTRRFDYRVR